MRIRVPYSLIFVIILLVCFLIAGTTEPLWKPKRGARSNRIRLSDEQQFEIMAHPERPIPSRFEKYYQPTTPVQP
jgi:hypothetical protein